MEETVQIIVAVTVLYLAYSWFTKPKVERAGGPTPAGGGGALAGGQPVLGQGAFRGVSESMVSNVSSAFPDIPRENIMYDLSKTKSAQVTVEKLLTTGFLPPPPAGMFPPPTPIIHLSNGPASSTSISSATSSSKPPNLIERFNLQSRLPSPKGKERAVVPDDEGEREEEGKGKGKVGSNAAKWESSADQREASLKKRKEEMVLEARKKLLAKRAKAQAQAVETDV